MDGVEAVRGRGELSWRWSQLLQSLDEVAAVAVVYHCLHGVVEPPPDVGR